ncbi:MFS transporter [Salinivibrio socompensis]|uniref:MFS transporter n=1 Tax=Salinivibrio socompensis TaxID=1510206 RepID=UPI001F0A31E6|nr:MFS transporter [Salinivibrio socompensis]
MYKGLHRNIYYVALARMILGMGNFIIPFLVLLFTDKLGYSASLAGECVGAILLLVCGFAPDAPVMVPAFLFAAYFFIGVALPASNALVADLSHAGNRDAVMSLSYLAYNLGSAIGPILAGYLFWQHTEWIFFGNGLAVLVGILVVAFLVNVTEQAVPESDSDLERAVEGSVWSVLKSRPYLIVFTLLCGMLWFALNQMTMASPLYLSHLFGQEGPVRFGQLMTYACVLVVIITPLLLRATSGNTETMALAYAGLLFVLGYGLVMLAPTIPVHFLAWFFLSAGEVLVLTKEGVYLANNSPASHRGRIQGVLITLLSLLLMPSFVLIGYVIDYVRLFGDLVACYCDGCVCQHRYAFIIGAGENAPRGHVVITAPTWM